METWWQYLLSGILGSILGGAIAGLVAMGVVARTNVHQSDLALAAIIEQRRLAAQASKEQEGRAIVQLRQQREMLEEQLRAQQAEARISRQIAAASDLATGIQALSRAFEAGKYDVTDAGLVTQSAAIRWRIDADDDALAVNIYELVVTYVAALIYLDRVGDRWDQRSKWFHELVIVGVSFSDCMIRLAKDQSVAISQEVSLEIDDHRTNLEALIEEFKAVSGAR